MSRAIDGTQHRPTQHRPTSHRPTQHRTTQTRRPVRHLVRLFRATGCSTDRMLLPEQKRNTPFVENDQFCSGFPFARADSDARSALSNVAVGEDRATGAYLRDLTRASGSNGTSVTGWSKLVGSLIG